MTNHWTYRAELDHVVDGDTFDVQVDLGFGTFKNIRVRLRGVDTAEVYGVEKDSEEYQQGKKHSDFVHQWFEDAQSLTVETHKDDKGKYGRYLADVINENGESLAEALTDEWPEIESGR